MVTPSKVRSEKTSTRKTCQSCTPPAGAPQRSRVAERREPSPPRRRVRSTGGGVDLKRGAGGVEVAADVPTEARARQEGGGHHHGLDREAAGGGAADVRAVGASERDPAEQPHPGAALAREVVIVDGHRQEAAAQARAPDEAARRREQLLGLHLQPLAALLAADVADHAELDGGGDLDAGRERVGEVAAGGLRQAGDPGEREGIRLGV
jgi:hypothetical protein